MPIDDEESKLIDPEAFKDGYAFSFKRQPYLGELFAEATNVDRELTIVIGAGVSMDAGLPSWPQLIDIMAGLIEGDELRDVVRRDQLDLARKTELILQLIKRQRGTATDVSIVREALYLKDPASVGRKGELALSIARLAAARNGKVRLVTTNFDLVVEDALSRYFNWDRIQPFSLKEETQWKDSLRDGQPGVLHVHGIVPPKTSRFPPSEEIVLAESQFFKQGGEVRRIISEMLTTSCCLFVGLSISDPNLVGPLYETHDEEDEKDAQALAVPKRKFALVVPKDFPKVDANTTINYSIETAEFMRKRLSLRTIMLKSYAQGNQVISDLSLAALEPERYNPDGVNEERALVYGNRMAKLLGQIYENIGCQDSEDVPVGQAGMKLHDNLYEALQRGPVALMRRLAARTKYGSHRIGGAGGEHFALFLWLRCRPLGEDNARYALRLVGTSAYVHREAWSAVDAQPIIRDSRLAAVKAVFRGGPLLANSEPRLTGERAWRGIVAYPIVVHGAGSAAFVNRDPADVLTVGAVTLNTTLYVDKHDDAIADADGEAPIDQLSLIAKVEVVEVERIFDSMADAVADVLS